MNQPDSDFDTKHLYPVYRTTLLISIQDAQTGQELFEELEKVIVLDKDKGSGYEAQTMRPDIPRMKGYWKVAFPDVVPRIRLQIFGGNLYRDLTMDIAINTRKRFMNVLVLMEKK